MVGHKEVWNMIIRSRQIWPDGHFLHDLDVYFFTALSIIVGIAFLVYADWDLRRLARKLDREIEGGDFWITVEEYNQIKKNKEGKV